MIGPVRIHGQLPALHTLPWNDPLTCIEIDFAPRRLDKFTGPQDDQQHQPQRDAGWLKKSGFIAIERCQKFGQLVRSYRREMPCLDRLQHVLHICGRIPLKSTRTTLGCKWTKTDQYKQKRLHSLVRFAGF
jgi:hypothetical protein